ncbi:MAG: hypothetical protein R3B70_25905 [Polyangiaceae bacterium]
MKIAPTASWLLASALAWTGCVSGADEDMEDGPSQKGSATTAKEGVSGVGGDEIATPEEAAWSVAGSLRDLALVPVVGAEERDESLNTVALALSGQQFQNQYCTGVDYCWLNQQGKQKIKKTAFGVEGHLNSLTGQVRVEIAFLQQTGNQHVPLAWKLVESHDVPAGNILHFKWTTPNDKRRSIRVLIAKAAGDQYHLAARWL